MLPWKAWRFIGLNVVRVLSLIALVLVLASNILVMVHDVNAVREWDKTVHVAAGTNTTLADDEELVDCEYIEGSTVPNSAAGPFWAVLNRILILLQVLILIFGEIGWPNSFFARFLPFLSDEHGLGAIGMLECLIGAQVNSHHVDDFAMVSAFLLFSIGCLNLILALIFGKNVKGHRSILSWRQRDILPKTTADLERAMSQNSSPRTKGSSMFISEKSYFPSAETHSSPSQSPYGRQINQGFLLGRSIDSLPKYAATRIPPSAHTRSDSRSTSNSPNGRSTSNSPNGYPRRI